MRSFQNGTFLTDQSGRMPVRNTMRVPLFNNPVPHVMRMLSPERLFRKLLNAIIICFAIMIVVLCIYDKLLFIVRCFTTDQVVSYCSLVRTRVIGSTIDKRIIYVD